ncbi:hypothetical protein BD779DRAFT_593044 [Infundibulicybe gibba]|nr:hypothetical protein BD779DRAFT_593044 [Infundibulicybe gibba]
MAPREPTRQQLSSKLGYSQNTPSFLLKFKNKMAGIPDEDDEEDPEFEDDGSGRPPIPRRPAIPERPADEAGSADEDDADEKPQVVVLREGKHLTEREAENVRRREKGLPPLPDSSAPAEQTPPAPPGGAPATGTKTPAPSLSFSSSKEGIKKPLGKRKAVGDPEGDKDLSGKKGLKKKPKKESKKLLSFGDDA